MFILKLYDRNGTELKEGDIVRISNGRSFNFFAQVKYLPEENIITPFHTFAFHSVEKVDGVPPEAVKSSEERYDVWYVCGDEPEADQVAKEHEQYIWGWRQCEHWIDNRTWKIEWHESEEV